MSHFRVNERDIYFILKEQLGYDSLCKLDRYRDLDVETLDMVVSGSSQVRQRSSGAPSGGRRQAWSHLC